MEHLEGKLSVLAALEARRRKITVVLVGDRAHADEVIEAATARGVPVRQVGEGEIDKVAHGRSHGGVVAMCTKLPLTTEAELLGEVDARKEAALLLMLEGVDDARNLGFTLRSADALGAHGVILKKHAWDFDEADLSRTSSGAYERLPLVRLDSELGFFRELRKRGVKIWGMHGGAKRTIYDLDLCGPVVLAVGGEKRGLSAAVRKACDGVAGIPTRAGATSLAMTQAAGIVLAEARRQRLYSAPAPT